MKQPLLSLYVHFSNSLHLSHGDFIFIIYYHLLNKYVGETKSDIGQDIEGLQTSIESQMEEMKNYIDGKFKVNNIALTGRTFKIINTGKVMFNLKVNFANTSIYYFDGTAELNVITTPAGTLVYGQLPEMQKTGFYLNSGTNPLLQGWLIPQNGYVAAILSTSLLYFSYLSAATVQNLSGATIGSINESPCLVGTSRGVSSVTFDNSALYFDAQSRTSITTSSYDSKIVGLGVMINFPGFLCLN